MVERILTQEEAAQLKTLETATVTVDCLVYDRGEDQTPRFVTIVSDTNDTEFVDDNGKASPVAKLLIAQAMQTQAIKQGATKVSASGCVDIGGLPQDEVDAIQNDSIYPFDEDSKLWLDHDELDTYMLENHLLLRATDMLVAMPISTSARLDGAFREPIEKLIPLVVDAIVKLINENFPFMKTYTGFIMTLVSMYGGVNNISKKYSDKMFTDVQAKLS